MENLEFLIVRNLVTSDDFLKKVIPYLRPEYFEDRAVRTIFSEIKRFVDEYRRPPTFESLLINIDELPLSEEQTTQCKKVLKKASSMAASDTEWLIDKTEKFCQERSVYLAIMKSIEIMDGKHKNVDRGGIPGILSDALSVSFDPDVGHDFLENAEDRFEYYTRKEEKVPFDLDYFNKITGGGVSKKSLSVALSPTGTGKTLFMCHFAANNFLQGKNVLYITLEMAAEMIGMRIDANIMDIDINKLKSIPHSLYSAQIKKIRPKTTGRLKIKEYPTATAGADDFRHLLNELKLKDKFVPDIIYIDYLNICKSSRIRSSESTSNSYGYVKSIAEEVRGLAVENNVPIITATQSNRLSYNNTEIDMSHTSESSGINATCDFMFSIVSTDELAGMGQILVKQLKNRFRDVNDTPKTCIGVDKCKMRLYELSGGVKPSSQGSNSGAPKQSPQKPPIARRVPATFGSLKV